MYTLANYKQLRELVGYMSRISRQKLTFEVTEEKQDHDIVNINLACEYKDTYGTIYFSATILKVKVLHAAI